MGEGEDKVGWLILLGIALAIGAWLLSEIFKDRGKNVKYYRCPHCGRMVKPHTNPCPWCGTSLVWNSSNVKEVTSNFFGTFTISIALLFCLCMSGLCTFCKPESLVVWTHLSAIFGGYMLSVVRYTIDPPK